MCEFNNVQLSSQSFEYDCEVFSRKSMEPLIPSYCNVSQDSLHQKLFLSIRLIQPSAFVCCSRCEITKLVKFNLILETLLRTDKLQSTNKVRSGKPGTAVVPISILQVGSGSLVVTILEELSDIFWGVCV